MTAQGEGGDFLNRLYVGIAPQPADARPPAFRSVERLADAPAGGDFVVRFAVTDSATTDTGPRLREAKVEANGVAAPAAFMGGDLFRAVIHAEGGEAVTYRACATDWAGNSACSGELTFAVAGGEAPAPAADGGGCGCRAAGDEGGQAAWLAAAAACAVAARRRRARRKVGGERLC